MTVIQEERRRLNAYAIEPKMYLDPKTMTENYVTHNEKAEQLNGRLAMLGIIAAFISYAATGKLFFGVW